MSTKRVPIARHRRTRITRRAVELFSRLCDLADDGDAGSREYDNIALELYFELDRRPWQCSILEVHEGNPRESIGSDPWRLKDWQDTLKIRRELLARVGRSDAPSV
jgi:hypothetical protein